MINKVNPITLLHFDRLRADLSVKNMPFMRELWDRNGFALHPLKMVIKVAMR